MAKGTDQPVRGESSTDWHGVRRATLPVMLAIADHCDACGKRHQCCPVEATREMPIVDELSTIRHTDAEMCFPHFSDNHGWSAPNEESPFNSRPHEDIKRAL